MPLTERIAISSHDDNFMYGSTDSNYVWWDASANTMYWRGAAKLHIGTGSSSAGAGIALSSTTTAAFRVYADDGGAAVGSGVLMRAGVFRTLLTYTAGNREQEAAGVIGQVVSVAGTNRHNMAGTWGSYEAQTSLVVDGQASSTDTWCQAAVLGRVGMGSGSLTVNANGVLAGVAAMSNINTAVSSTYTGAYTGLYVGGWGSSENFEYGIYAERIVRAGYFNSALTGSSALNSLEVTVGDATTPSSGYAHGIHVTYNKSGVDTGSGCSTMQFNAIGADVTISGAGGGKAGYYSLYTYVAVSGSPDLSGCVVFGCNVEMTEMGATDYYGGLWINKYNTTAGNLDTFILCSNQASGVTTAGIYFQGTKPTYFLQFAAADGFLETDTDELPGNATHKLKCRVGTTDFYLIGVTDF